MKDVILSGEMPKRNSIGISGIKKSTIVEIISALLILLFMYAALSKLLDYENFRVQLGKSPFITKYAETLAWALPTTEILIGLTLMINYTKLIGLYASLFLMSLFTAYIYSMLQFSFYIPCSCGGILSSMDWKTHLWFNVVIVIFSIWGILLQTSKYTKRIELG